LLFQIVFFFPPFFFLMFFLFFHFLKKTSLQELACIADNIIIQYYTTVSLHNNM
jgi:hypothetical protein